MNTYGYCRISTSKQNIERQVRNIETAYPNAIIIREVYTGTKHQEREKFNCLIHGKNGKGGIKPNETIVFDSVSRMSRNAEDGFKLYKKLFEMGVNLVFLKEPHINTDTYKQAIEKTLSVDFDISDKDTKNLMNSIIAAVNTYVLSLAEKQIYLAFSQSEKEVADLHQRTREGIITAKLNGKQIGQPKGTKLTTKKSIEAKKQIKKYNNSFDGTLNNEDTWKLIGISKMTFYKYKSEMIADDSMTV